MTIPSPRSGEMAAVERLIEVVTAQQAGIATLTTTVAVVGTKVDNLAEKVDGKVADHEDRLRALEKRVWQIAGGAAFLAFGAPLAVQLLAK